MLDNGVEVALEGDPGDPRDLGRCRGASPCSLRCVGEANVRPPLFRLAVFRPPSGTVLFGGEPFEE